MIMKSKILFLLVACGGFLIASSQNIKNSSKQDGLVTTVCKPNATGYTVTWYDSDNTTPLEVDTDVKTGTMPHYNGPTPTKEATTAGTIWAFFGWSLGEPRERPDEGRIQTVKDANQEYFPIFLEMTDPSYSPIKLVVDCVDCLANGKVHFEKSFNSTAEASKYIVHFDLPSDKYVHSLTTNDITTNLASKYYKYDASTHNLTIVVLPSGTSTFTAVADSSAVNLLYNYDAISNQVRIDFDNPSAIKKIDWGDTLTSTSAPFVHEYASTVKTAKIRVYVEEESNGLTSFSLSDQSGPLAAGNNNISEVNYGHTFTNIPASAFKGCIGLTNLNIGTSITSIDPAAFANTENLSTLTINEYNAVYNSPSNSNAIINIDNNELVYAIDKIPQGVEKIGSHAFSTSKITSIRIPKTVKTINDYAFDGCPNLQTVIIPENLTTIGTHAFNDCPSIKYVDFTISDKLATVSTDAFPSLPATPTAIFSLPSDKFSSYSELLSQYSDYIYPLAEVPVGVFSITTSSADSTIPFELLNYNDIQVDWGDGSDAESSSATTSVQAFTHTYSNAGGYTIKLSTTGNVTGFKFTNNLPCLDSVILNTGFVDDVSGATPIYAFSFKNCQNLVSVLLPSTITQIAADAFNTCVRLLSIVIPNGVTTMGKTVFDKCQSLESISLPASLETFVSDMVAGCINLSSITIDENNPNFTTRGNRNALFNKQGDKLLLACSTSDLPDDLKIIGSYVYSGVSSLPKLPISVTTLEDFAFYQPTSSITSIDEDNMPGVTTIGNNLLSKQTGITTITFGEKLETIGALGIVAKLSSLTFKSKSLISIGDKCVTTTVNLDVYVYSEVPPTCTTKSFLAQRKVVTIHVPATSLAAYKGDANWSAYPLVGDL